MEGTFYEYGTIPPERSEAAPEQGELIKDLQNGMSIMEILNNNPKFVFRIREMEVLRQTILSEKYSKITRDLTVTYLFGSTGTGKTWGIFNKYDPRDICRITNYGTKNGIKFDSYYFQGTLVFEEFHSQIPIADMLNYLDKYPLTLPARYSDRQACYTQVFLTSNAALDEQYPDIQRNQLETWCAFNRRINNVVEFLPDGSRIVHKGVNPFD